MMATAMRASRPIPIIRVCATGREPFGFKPVTAAKTAMSIAMPSHTSQFIRNQGARREPCSRRHHKSGGIDCSRCRSSSKFDCTWSACSGCNRAKRAKRSDASNRGHPVRWRSGSRSRHAMDAGNELREKTTKDVMARLAITRIRVARQREYEDESR